MIEAVLLKHLQSHKDELGQHLATYGEQLAIFNQEAPADTAKGWGKGSQYGRIVYAVDLSEDPQRKYSGILAVDVMCEKGKQFPEDIEPIIRTLIDGYFFSTKDITMAAQWSASNYFTEPTDKIIGVTLTFGLLAFTKQTTIAPDPIALFNKWTREELEKVLEKTIHIIGYDNLEEAWKPTNEQPAIYWRMESIAPCGWIPDTYNCTWQTAIIAGHIMALDKDVNAIIARTIDNILTHKKRLIFDDMAPLMVDRNIRINLSADQLRVGQITIDATFGILRTVKGSTYMNHISVNGKEI